ncbi:CocE/NonD family hydrolase [Bifidobacterium parmae]|uniref:Hydrolase CocE/NonD family protein n=1 Tax=Bifidobacterium parmae TaxID=361854 RepID=A0A2N5IWA3_9BIFI|nr:CocE/NonD family hydrolase [Bifidobacterium parmae]PLS26243.1 hydrolase CocE/NonD family protein [Bifidobacterium parmae]
MTDTTNSSAPLLDVNGSDILFKPANPLDKAKPPIPPLETRTVLYRKGSVNAKGAMRLPIDIECLEDIPIELRDGTVIYGDLWRRQGDTCTPVILVYSLYSKRGGPFNANYDVTSTGFPKDQVSGLQRFESPDPAYWCRYGYAICVVDERGIGHSGGDMYFMGTQAGRDVHDTIEYIAGQDWCTGKVCMMGNSQLAMIQWAAAAAKPAHLAAIAPWEGLTDEYRDVVCRGGIPNGTFHDIDIVGFLYGQSRFEDVTGMLEQHPLVDDYWTDKIPDLEHVTVPAYVVASWTHPIHTRSTLSGFKRLGSTDKWLRIHDTHEWGDLDTRENCDDLRRFFDHYLKGIDNGWERAPRVRYSRLDVGAKHNLFSTSDDYPCVRTETMALYLNASDGTMNEQKAALESSAEYDAVSRDMSAVARFEYRIPRDMEIHGPLNARLWMSTDAGDDMDLFAQLYKKDAKGKVLYHVVFPGLEKKLRMMIALTPKGKQLPGGPIYVGPNGRLRASHRELDTKRSTPTEPYMTYTNPQPVTPFVPVQIDLGLWPTDMLLHEGETLVLEIGGHACGPVAEARASDEAPDAQLPTVNQGRHTVHTGGVCDSVLLMPIAKP